MTKTPDEIKQGLEEEIPVHYHIDGEPRLTPRLLMDMQWLHKDALALIQQLQAENAEQAEKIQQLESDKQQLEGMLTHMNQLRDAAAERALKMEERVHQLEAERDALKDALGLMVYQYCVRGTTLDHHFMCAGETAFQVLGLEQYGDVKKLEDWLFPEPPKEEAK